MSVTDSDKKQPSAANEDREDLRQVPIEWESLEDAFENNAPEVHSYLHLVTGEVLRVVDGVADPDMHTRIASEMNYLRVEPVSSREQYRWMERFIPMVENNELRGALAQSIDGKGAFRRFKDALAPHAGERERWFAFRSERLRVFMEAWLAAHAIAPVARPSWEPEADTPLTPSLSPETAEVAPGPSDTLRKQLIELIETLGARDLDKVLTFAEFVHARRASCPPIGKTAAMPKPQVVPAPAEADSDDGEEPTPSSRRRTAGVVR